MPLANEFSTSAESVLSSILCLNSVAKKNSIEFYNCNFEILVNNVRTQVWSVCTWRKPISSIFDNLEIVGPFSEILTRYETVKKISCRSVTPLLNLSNRSMFHHFLQIICCNIVTIHCCVRSSLIVAITFFWYYSSED